MVASSENCPIRSCVVLLNEKEVTDYLTEQKKRIFLSTVGLRNNYCLNDVYIPKMNFTKRCRDRRKLLLRRAKRMADQPFLNAKRDASGGLYFKFRRHVIENFRNALFCKIASNNCRVVLTPIVSSDHILSSSDDISDSLSSSPLSFSGKDHISANLFPAKLPPLPMRILDRYSPVVPFLNEHAFNASMLDQKSSQ